MKLFKYMKDGGSESKVWGFFFAEIKSKFSIALLHFKNGSREAFHSHAFNSISWVIKGKLVENMINGNVNVYTPSLKPVITRRESFHKVVSFGDTWAFTLRGPWADKWQEYLPDSGNVITLTHGRNEVKAS